MAQQLAQRITSTCSRQALRQAQQLQPARTISSSTRALPITARATAAVAPSRQMQPLMGAGLSRCSRIVLETNRSGGGTATAGPASTSSTISSSASNGFLYRANTSAHDLRQFSTSTSSPSSSSSSSAANSAGFTLPGTKENAAYILAYTCDVCKHREAKKISKNSYHNGIVIVTCSNCKNRHLIADNLNWFGDQKQNVEDFMRDKGEVFLSSEVITQAVNKKNAAAGASAAGGGGTTSTSGATTGSGAGGASSSGATTTSTSSSSSGTSSTTSNTNTKQPVLRVRMPDGEIREIELTAGTDQVALTAGNVLEILAANDLIHVELPQETTSNAAGGGTSTGGVTGQQQQQQQNFAAAKAAGGESSGAGAVSGAVGGEGGPHDVGQKTVGERMKEI
ncbi:unnamed protein product [Amoebophrya sp. A120]|nr:unnamed protein product [Amoebophrya sp. A120]|eukprot:GSA120T00008436001.1